MLDRVETGPIETNFRGVPYRFYLDNMTDRKAMLGTYNNRELDFLLSFLTSGHATFLDIGANSGLYTQYMVAKAPSGTRVIAVEPNEIMCERIAQNLSLLDARVRAAKSVVVERCAVGDRSGTAFLALDRGYGQAYVVSDPRSNTVEVAMRTLLDVLRENQVTGLDGLKIDIEGYEDEALVPFFAEAPRTLYPRAMVIEHTSKNRWEADLFQLFTSLGYREVWRTHSNALLAL
jgi:FkbM family methyltransferase